MTILVVATLKGGAAKTTLIGLLAPLFARDRIVILLDTDPSRTLLSWSRKRGRDARVRAVGVATEAELHRTLDAILSRFRDDEVFVMIDLPANAPDLFRAAARRSDYLVMPTKACQVDLEGAVPSVELLTQEGVQHAIVLVDTAPRRAEGDAPDVRLARAILKPAGGRVWSGQITSRVAIPRAIGLGRSIVETAPDSPGADEVRRLYDVILRELARIRKR